MIPLVGRGIHHEKGHALGIDDFAVLRCAPARGALHGLQGCVGHIRGFDVGSDAVSVEDVAARQSAQGVSWVVGAHGAMAYGAEEG